MDTKKVDLLSQKDCVAYTSKRYNKAFKDKVFAVALVVPAFLMISFTILFPLLNVIRMSFLKYSLMAMQSMPWNNFANYKALFEDMEFVNTFGRTLVYVFSTAGLALVIGFSTSLLLNSGIAGQKLFRGLIFLPWTVPTLVVAVLWMWIYQPQYGILNYILNSLHIINNNKQWLGDVKLALPSVIIAAVWKQMPFMMVMLLAALQTVPKELEEAAIIDGATGIQKFFNITVPCTMSVMKTITLTSVITNFQMFGLFFTMTGGGPVKATTTLTIYTYQTAFMRYNMGKGAAIGVIWMAFLILFSTFYNKMMSKKEAFSI